MTPKNTNTARAIPHTQPKSRAVSEGPSTFAQGAAASPQTKAAVAPLVPRVEGLRPVGGSFGGVLKMARPI